MSDSYNRNIAPNAKALRRSMTKEERRLWYDFLRHHPLHFYKQRIIGNYIVDFYCAEAKLVVELDGSQHFDETGIEYDKKRTETLERRGLRVIRIPNNEINHNFRAICEYIDSFLTSQSPYGDSSP